MTFEENMKLKNKYISKFACKDEEAFRLKEEKEDARTPFFHDIDRIIYSLSYVRYSDKTQVFTFNENDHISKRMTHVQYVSKIARTLGRGLNLNEDLIEAAALGHDLGHVPFGHVGEDYLNKISLKHNEGYFNHNVQSVRLLKDIENYGNGYNITFQVLDGILCHNGELPSQEYRPIKKSKEDFLKIYNETYTNKSVKLVPSTLEGCVVRISDLIGYLGRDIEDGLRMKLINYDDIPKEITAVLGVKNREIVNNIMKDLLDNSLDKDYIKLSDKVFDAIVKLKKFNHTNIYAKAYTDEERLEIENMFNKVFEKCLNDILEKNEDAPIIKSYLNNMSEEYKKNTSERIVIDYIAGMTDAYFIKTYNSINKDK